MFGLSALNTVLCQNHFLYKQRQEIDVGINLDNNLRTKTFRSTECQKDEEEDLRKLRKGERKISKSAKQVEQLKIFYDENPLPSPCTYQRIAVQTGLTAR